METLKLTCLQEDTFEREKILKKVIDLTEPMMTLTFHSVEILVKFCGNPGKVRFNLFPLVFYC